MGENAFYASQSRVSDPGRSASRTAEVEATLPAMAAAARELVFHYRADGDFAENGIAAERIAEIDTRYAEDMFARLAELADRPLTEPRKPSERLVGCCRDFTLGFLAIARSHGVPARARVGFASYFAPGWYVDHVVAEVWDADQSRWRLVDAELPDDFQPADGVPMDPQDVPASRFLTGPAAWVACRAGAAHADRFAVDPGLEIPATRGWPYVLHNLVHDLASLAKHEMVLWDNWGLSEIQGELTAVQLELLDAVAAATSASDVTVAQIQSFYQRDELRVPPVVTSYSAASEAPLRVDVSRSL